MKSKSKLIITLILFFGICFYFVLPVEVEGVVERKAIHGEMSGNTGEMVLENLQYPGMPWIFVENKDFEQFFSPEDKNVYVNDSMKELLERKYIGVNYYVAIHVSSDDPVNDVPEGEAFTYFVSLEDFNKVKIGDEITYKVSRYRFARIDRITVL
ncbi:MAG: hypothetical protein RBT65_01785 [Methanolobus sp.]|nr:hypothetical protein [Methanolobus sp.]